MMKRKNIKNIVKKGSVSGTKKSISLGLVIPRYNDMFHSFYAMQVIQGIGYAAERFKMDLVLHVTNGERKLINLSVVEGVVFADIIGNEEQVDDVLSQNIPCVIMNYLTKDLHVNCISIDNFNAARKAVNYLIAKGHSKIATITGALKTQVGIDRLNGYLAGIEKGKAEKKNNYIKYGDFGRESAIRAARELVRLKTPPTAIFTASDEMAVGTIQVLLENGIKVPNDISVIGFDDNPLALNFSPVPITTVRQPLQEMAALAVATLHKVISGKARGYKKIVLPCELIERASVTSLT